MQKNWSFVFSACFSRHGITIAGLAINLRSDNIMKRQTVANVHAYFTPSALTRIRCATIVMHREFVRRRLPGINLILLRGHILWKNFWIEPILMKSPKKFVYRSFTWDWIGQWIEFDNVVDEIRLHFVIKKFLFQWRLHDAKTFGR